MLTYLKVNSGQALEWNEDPEDLSMFVINVATQQHEFGFSTCVAANTKHQRDVNSKFRTGGCSTTKLLTQFDVQLETSLSSLPQEGMRVVGWAPSVDALMRREQHFFNTRT